LEFESKTLKAVDRILVSSATTMKPGAFNIGSKFATRGIHSTNFAAQRTFCGIQSDSEKNGSGRAAKWRSASPWFEVAAPRRGRDLAVHGGHGGEVHGLPDRKVIESGDQSMSLYLQVDCSY